MTTCIWAVFEKGLSFGVLKAEAATEQQYYVFVVGPREHPRQEVNCSMAAYIVCNVTLHKSGPAWKTCKNKVNRKASVSPLVVGSGRFGSQRFHN